MDEVTVPPGESERLTPGRTVPASTQADQLRLITDALPALISYVDREQRYRFNNRAYLDWFGHTAEELHGKHIVDVLGEEAYAKVRAYVDAVLAGERVGIEATLNYKDGGPRHVGVNYIPDVDEEGHVRGYVALVTDLTERRRTEERIASLNSELRGRLEELQTIMNLSPVGVFVAHDAACSRITMNRAGAAMLRVPLDANSSLTGTPPGELPFRVCKNGVEVPGPDLPMQRAARLGVPVMNEEVDVVFENGDVTTLYEFALPLFDDGGGVRGCVGLFVDITERKRAEAALRESEARFRQVAEVTAQFIWVARADGTLEYVNERWTEYSGLDVTGTADPARRRGVLHPDDVAAVFARWRACWAAGEILETEARLRSRSGEYRWFLIRVVPFRDDAGRLIKWFGTSTDIHQRKLEDADTRWLADLSERLRRSDDRHELMDAVVRSVGEHFGVARCLFSEIDEPHDTVRIVHQYRASPDAAPLPPAVRLSDYPPDILAHLQEGRPFATADAGADPRTRASFADGYERLGARAYVSVPLLRANRRAGALSIVADRPREWTTREISLLELVADRAWNAAEKLRLHAELRQSEETLQAALEGGGLGVWSWDPATGLTTADARVRELFGLPHEEPAVRIEHVVERVHPEDREAVVESLRRAQQPGHDYSAEFRVVRPDGGVRWLAGAGRGRFGPDGRVIQVYGVNFDITERKRAERNTRFLLELDAALGTVHEVDAIGQVAVERLAAHLDLHRCHFTHIEGRTAVVREEWRRRGPALAGSYTLDGSLTDAQWAAYQAGRSLVVEDVTRDARVEAHAKLYEAFEIRSFVGTPIKHGDRWVAALTCASDRPRQWRRDELQLMRDVVARVWPLMEQARAAQALREADRRKDEFLAMLAHELRNPLAPIRSAAEVLKLAAGPDANGQWAREVIERQTQHLTRLVDDLLDVSRITSGKVTLQREPLDLAIVVQRAVETTRTLFDARRHHLDVELPDSPVCVDGDLTRLVQVVGNLLNNAAKYTDDGGHIRVSVAREGDRALVRVVDDGMGIAADLLPHVFDLFTQANRGLDRSQGGLGIGLTLARQLAELHGGRVTARSEGPGHGSQFVLTLPALPAATKLGGVVHVPEELPPAPDASLRVLVVEDNADAAEMLAFLLRSGGHTVETAGDGHAAVEAARSFAPHVVLCDIGLPGINGYEVAARLRADAAFANTRLVAITGYGQDEDRRRAREAGFDHHLTKPVEPRSLEALLARLVPRC